MDRGAWQATVHGVAKSRTQLIKHSTAFAGEVREAGLIPGSGRYSRRAWKPTPVFLPEESHGQKSLADSMHIGLKQVLFVVAFGQWIYFPNSGKFNISKSILIAKIN